MIIPEVNNLISSIEQLANDKVQPIHENGYIQLSLVNNNVELFIYEKDPNLIDNDKSKRSIFINKTQLVNEYEKILNRIKVVIGKGKREYARNSVVARIDKKVAMEFLKDHHLNVAFPGKYRYGLFMNGELMSVAIFSGGRRIKDKPEGYRSFELIRFCHKSDYLIVGGISKLIKSFIKDFKPGDIMTYADALWTQESSLEIIGFKEESFLEPQLFWITKDLQIPINEESEIEINRNLYPSGYLNRNRGSIKMRLTL